MVVWVSLMLRRAVCGDADRRFDNLSVSHLQTVMLTSTQVGLFHSRPQSCERFGQRHGSRPLAGAMVTRKRDSCPFL